MGTERSPFRPSPREALSEDLFRAGLVSAAAFGLTTGVQFTFALVMTLGPRAPWPPPEDLTIMGQVNLHPEYDLPAFALGCALSLALMVLLAWRWSLGLARFDAQRIESAATFSIQLYVVLSVAGSILFFFCTELVRRSAYNRWHLSQAETLLLLATPTAMLAIALFHTIAAPREPIRSLLRVALRRSKLANLGCDIAMPLIIVLLVYIPALPQFMGGLYLSEEFFHWDHFAMARTLGYLHGAALGTDLYAQYGVGWPVFFALISPVYSLSYTHMLQTSILFGCAYYIGLYILLRRATQHALLSCAATFFALWLTLFAPIFASLHTLWQWPSTSILRAPFDLWVFLALLLHLQTGKRFWSLVAGIFLGLGILFETDTGLALAIVFAAYCIGFALLRAEAARPIATPRWRLTAWGIAIFVVLDGLLAASRGTLFTSPADFWPGWLQGVTGSAGSGIGSMYFLSRSSIIDLTIFFIVVAIFLGTVGRALLQTFVGRLNRDDLFLGCVGLYGLARCVMFVQRSLPNNLLHTAVPLTIVIATVAARALKNRNEEHSKNSGHFQTAFRNLVPFGCVTLASVLLWFSPTFHEYPSLLKTLAKGAPEPGLYLIPESKEIGGLPESSRERIAQFNETIAKMRALHDTDARIVVLDEQNTLYYLASGVPPWGRDSTLFYNTLTLDQQQALLESLLAYRPDYLLIQKEGTDDYYTDTREFVREALSRHYERTGTAGQFDLWSARAF